MNPFPVIARAVAAVFVLIFVLVAWPFFTVGPGEVGVTFNNLNGQTKSHTQGLHFRVPFMFRVYKFDVKTRRVDLMADSATKDLQHVSVHVVLNFHLEQDKVNQLFENVGRDYQEKVIEPAVNESVKAAVSQFPVEDIIVKRGDLKHMIEAQLKERLGLYHILVESVNLVDIRFTDEFNRVVEQKQVEEQKIKTAEYQKRQAEQYKLKTILEAQAEAEKQRLMRENVTDNIVALEWIKKWNGQLPSTVMGEKGGAMLMMPQEKK